MNSFSHILIGNFLHQYLREQHNIELSPGSFIYGNLLPDFKPAYKKLPHEKDYWSPYLKSEIGKLSAFRQDSRSFGVHYSRRLGVICHFYADFFCFAHTAGFEGGTYPHIRYELALHRHLQDNMPVLDGTEFVGDTARGRDAGMIQGRFNALQEKYLKEPPSFAADIAYTLSACVDVTTAVVGNSLVLKKPKIIHLLPGPAKG
jgi:hypothetical protein